MAYGTTAYNPLLTSTTGTGVTAPLGYDNPGGPNGPHGPDNDPNIIWDPETGQYMNKPEFDRAHGNTGSDGNSPTAHGIALAQPYNVTAEANRYGAAAMNPLYTSGPQIDQAQSNETRGLSMGALGLLGARANGAETPADVLAKQQTTGAVNAVQSTAASVRGGAGARAAAARGAVQTGARVQAEGDQNAAALHARGMADAAGQYFGATSGQRGIDQGLATEQAKLDAAQRVANEQRSENYEGLRFGVQKEAVDTALGRSAAEQAASNTARNQGLAESNASFDRTTQATSAGVGAVGGGLQAYNQTQKPAPSDNPWDPSNYQGSDVRSKTDVKPLTPSAKVAPGYDRSMFARHSEEAPEYDTATVNQNLGAVVARDAALEQARQDQAEDAAKAQRFGVTGAPMGYAAMRAGQQGAMFGRSMAPARDYGDKARAMRNREVLLSDPRAKQEAFDHGVRAGFDAGQTPEGRARLGLDTVSGPRGKVGQAAGGHAAGTTVERATPSAPTPNFVADMKRGVERQLDSAIRPAARSTNTIEDPGVQLGQAIASHVPQVSENEKIQNEARIAQARNSAERFAAPKAAWLEQNVPGARAAGDAFRMQNTPPPRQPIQMEREFTNPADRDAYIAQRATTPSDPRTKENVRFGGPMAEANRSMAPSVYEYKVEYTPPDQSPHEKNVGPMANKMEADPIARTAIVKDPSTGLLAIDKTKALKLALGGLSSLQMQVDALEKKKAAGAR